MAVCVAFVLVASSVIHLLRPSYASVAPRLGGYLSVNSSTQRIHIISQLLTLFADPCHIVSRSGFDDWTVLFRSFSTILQVLPV